MTVMTDGAGSDPGWPRPRPLGTIVAIVAPWVMFVPRGDVVPLLALRRVFVTFLILPLVYLGPLMLLMPLAAASSVDLTVWLLLGFTLLPVGGALLFGRRTPPCGDPSTLNAWHRSILLASLALSLSAVLFGFVAAFIAGGYWPYLLCWALAAIAFWRTAPTSQNIARIDDRLRAAGCPDSLWAASLTPGAGPPGHSPGR